MHKFKKKLFYGIFNNNNTNIISSCMDSVLDAESNIEENFVGGMLSDGNR